MILFCQQTGSNLGECMYGRIPFRPVANINHVTRLHYIPVTQGYSEIYNIWSYFSGPTQAMTQAANQTRASFGGRKAALAAGRLDGDAELRKIAKAGRSWKYTHGRKVDMEVYVYRRVQARMRASRG